jgi:hypothetical protein
VADEYGVTMRMDKETYERLFKFAESMGIPPGVAGLFLVRAGFTSVDRLLGTPQVRPWPST